MRHEEKKPVLSEPSPGLSPLPERPISLEGAWKYAFPVLLVLYLVMAIVHARTTPMGFTGLQNAPDEQAHYTYILDIAKGHLPTQQSSSANPTAYEWHQPPLYYLLSAPFALSGGVLGVRLFSVFCGAVGLGLIYFTIRRLFPKDGVLPVVGVGLVALMPSHIALTSTINNDVLLEVCFSATVCLLVLMLRRGVQSRDALFLGFCVGAGCLTKATGILLVPVVLFALLLMAKNRESRPSLSRLMGISAAIVVLLSGWWFVRNGVLYGEVLPLKAFSRAFAGTALAKDFVAEIGWDGYLIHVGQRSFQSFWAVFGTPKSAERGIQLFLPNVWYGIMVLWAVGVCIGMIRLHFQRSKLFSKAQLQSLWVVFLTLGLVFVSFFGFILQYYQAQGRYLYPAMLPISIIGAMGWLALFPNRLRGFGGLVLLGYLAVFSLFYLLVVIP